MLCDGCGKSFRDGDDMTITIPAVFVVNSEGESGPMQDEEPSHMHHQCPDMDGED